MAVKKIIACGDIHFKSLTGIDELKNVLNGFIEQCREIVKNEGKENVRIVVLGDIFDSKINVTNESILAVHWFLKELNNTCKTIVIAGNHDFLMNNKDRIDSLTPIFEMGNLENVVYIDKTLDYKSGFYVDDDVVWTLYSSFDNFNTPDIKAEKVIFDEDNYSYIGLIHADINGATSNTNYIVERGVDPAVFEGLKFCFAGHIHRFQEIKKNGVKCVYCSSIKQKDFGETVTEHGFVVLDLKNKKNPKYEFIEVENNDGGYYKFEVNEIDDIENDYENLVNL